jgi:transposase
VRHPEEEALGRSRVGLSTKVHLACDGKGRPLSVVVTAGQRHEGAHLGAVLDAIRVPRAHGCPGRPRKRPDHLLADRAYGYDAHRRLLRRGGIPHTIPQRRDHRLKKAARAGRPPSFDATLYARRNVVERCVNKLKQWRGIATRYEKRALNYRAAMVIAALMMWLV